MLLIASHEEFEIGPRLEAFAELCRSSSEYQGHGWGVLYGGNGHQRLVKRPHPIWEEQFGGLGTTRFLLAHARSAFQDGPVAVEYNMPFVDDRYSFAFNGELHGVRIRAAGRTGAEKIFNLVRRLDRGDIGAALRDAVRLIRRRTRHIRAMNLILTDGRQAWVCSLHNERPEYFTMYAKRDQGLTGICSEPLPGERGWTPLPNDTIEVLPCC
jgi:glutamine amidotransferase